MFQSMWDHSTKLRFQMKINEFSVNVEKKKTFCLSSFNQLQNINCQ